MLRQGTTWVACLAVGAATLAVTAGDAEASWRRARRLGNNGYNQACCQTGYSQRGFNQNAGFYNGGQIGGACCGVTQQYQQATWQQPAGNACNVQQIGTQSYDHRAGYAPQGQYHQGGIQQTGAHQQPPAPPVESDDAPRTFQEAPQPTPSEPNKNESDRS